MLLVSVRDCFCRLIVADLSNVEVGANIYKLALCVCIYSVFKKKFPLEKSASTAKGSIFVRELNMPIGVVCHTGLGFLACSLFFVRLRPFEIAFELKTNEF